MENKKDIGKAFREKLDKLDKTAPDTGWYSISKELLLMKKPYKFSWAITSIISLTVIAVIVATYPLWQENLPHIYIEMPNPDRTGNDNNNVSKGGATEKVNIVVTDTSPNSNTTEKRLNEAEGNTHDRQSHAKSAEMVNNTTPDTANNRGIPMKKIIPAGEQPETGNNTPFSGADSIMPETDGKIPETATTAGNDEETGKIKLLDLSGVSYGADTLESKKQEKLDFSKIADSLNKLYGREKEDKKRETQKN